MSTSGSMASQTESILITSSPIQPAPTKANLKRKASKAAPPASAKGSLSSSEKAAGAKKQKANTEAATVGAAKDSNAPPKGYVAVNGVPSELWSEKALKRYKTLRIKSDKCDPDQFDMHVNEDFYNYACMAIIEKDLSDLNKIIKKDGAGTKKAFEHLEALTFWIEKACWSLGNVECGEGLAALIAVFGAAWVTVVDGLRKNNKLNDKYIPNISNVIMAAEALFRTYNSIGDEMTTANVSMIVMLARAGLPANYKEDCIAGDDDDDDEDEEDVRLQIECEAELGIENNGSIAVEDLRRLRELYIKKQAAKTQEAADKAERLARGEVIDEAYGSDGPEESIKKAFVPKNLNHKLQDLVDMSHEAAEDWIHDETPDDRQDHYDFEAMLKEYIMEHSTTDLDVTGHGFDITKWSKSVKAEYALGGSDSEDGFMFF